MVTADSLNLDILELIFSGLNGRDLVSLSLVNRKFLSGVVPSLYRTLVFQLKHAKRYTSMVSPFTAVLSHPTLATHIRRIDIRASPLHRGEVHTAFIRDCQAVLRLCDSLVAFACTEPRILALLLPFLRSMHQIHDLRIAGTLAPEQSDMLLPISGIRNLSIPQASWSTIDLLPRWLASNTVTLRKLSLDHSHNLSAAMLETILCLVPELRTLHLVGCPKLDHNTVLRLCDHVPGLETLAFTIWEKSRVDPNLVYPHCPSLRHLTIDSKVVPDPSNTTTDSAVIPIWTSILTDFAPSSLSSLALKASEAITVDEEFLECLVEGTGESLKRLTFTNITFTTDLVQYVCEECCELETLGLMLNDKELSMPDLSDALASSASLRTLINSADALKALTTHDPLTAVSRTNVIEFMQNVPRLRRIVSDNRDWVGRDTDDGNIKLTLEKLRPSSPGLSFMFQ